MNLYPFVGCEEAAPLAVGAGGRRRALRAASGFVHDAAGFLRAAVVLPWQPAGPEA
jgi:hypothetical protein